MQKLCQSQIKSLLICCGFQLAHDTDDGFRKHPEESKESIHRVWIKATSLLSISERKGLDQLN